MKKPMRVMLAKIMAMRLCEYINLEDPKARFKTSYRVIFIGPHDKFDPKYSHLLPAIIHKVHQAKIEGAPNVEIWGNGKARREFMYAPDLADAVLRAANDIETCPELINIGLGYDCTINEYYSEVADVVDWHGKFTHDLSRPVGMNKSFVMSAVQQSGAGVRQRPCELALKRHTSFIAKGMVNDTQISACNFQLGSSRI